MDIYTMFLALVLASTLLITRGEASACGGNFTENTGVITSPGYPDNYPHNQDCTWQIDLTPPSRIYFQFATMKLEHHATCGYDYLLISAPGMAPVSFCDDVTPDPLMTPGSSATVTFHSDGRANDKGFSITYSTVTGFMEDILERFDRLEATNRAQNATIQRLEAESTALKEKDNEQDTTMTDNKRELGLQLDDLTNSVSAVQQCSRSRVAFTAGLSRYRQHIVSFRKTVVYDQEIYNPRNAYNTATGKFRCPVAGVYVFIANGLSSGADKPSCIALRLNGKMVTLASGRDKNYAAAATTSMTLHLDVGETVDVVACSISYLFGHTPFYNTFTGVLLSADTCM